MRIEFSASIVHVHDKDTAHLEIESKGYDYEDLKELIQALSLAHAQLKEPIEAEHGDYRVYAEQVNDG